MISPKVSFNALGILEIRFSLSPYHTVLKKMKPRRVTISCRKVISEGQNQENSRGINLGPNNTYCQAQINSQHCQLYETKIIQQFLTSLHQVCTYLQIYKKKIVARSGIISNGLNSLKGM
jgi:hypothetical protein